MAKLTINQMTTYGRSLIRKLTRARHHQCNGTNSSRQAFALTWVFFLVQNSWIDSAYFCNPFLDRVNCWVRSMLIVILFNLVCLHPSAGWLKLFQPASQAERKWRIWEEKILNEVSLGRSPTINVILHPSISRICSSILSIVHQIINFTHFKHYISMFRYSPYVALVFTCRNFGSEPKIGIYGHLIF